MVLLGIPILIITVILTFVFNIVQKKLKTKWIQAAVVTLFVSFFIFFLAVHTLNILNGASVTDPASIDADAVNNPDYMASQPSVLSLFINALIKSFIVGVIFSLLLLPFAFLGVSVFDFFQKKIPGIWSRLAIVCFLSAILLVVLLAAFPWIPVSLVYLAFYGI